MEQSSLTRPVGHPLPSRGTGEGHGAATTLNVIEGGRYNKAFSRFFRQDKVPEEFRDLGDR